MSGVYHGVWIVVIDDHPDSLEVICACLTWIGHECIGVTTRTEALRVVRARRPQLVILDLGLPNIEDGLDLARTIRSTQGAPSFLVAMTGWFDALARVPEVGFDDHLLKPFGLERLRALCGRFEARLASLTAPPGS